MTLKKYVWLWFAILLLLAFEYAQLNSGDPGFLSTAKLQYPELKNLNLSPEPGRPISLWLGYAGFGFMLVTNLYIIRKRLGLFKTMGKTSGWLDFHIFCGLLGPLLIVFHTNFKVRGLVSISFWSMMIVALSGVLGRYFYGQVVQVKGDLVRESDLHSKSLANLLARSSIVLKPEQLKPLLDTAAQWVGAIQRKDGRPAGFLATMLASSAGDIRLFLGMKPPIPMNLPRSANIVLKNYGLAVRKIVFFETFQRYLGYWHSFHLPFAFFMYIVAIIHIISALLFGVKG